MDRIAAQWGGVEVLVNNAALFPPLRQVPTLPFEEVPDRAWTHLARTNIEGPVRMLQAVLPTMRASGWGRIVNVSSIAATDGMTGFAWYSAAKAALHGLSRSVAREVGGAGVLVNVVMPGATMTERVRSGLPRALLDRHVNTSITGRVPGPEAVASVIVFLCSAVNTAISGEVVRVSG